MDISYTETRKQIHCCQGAWSKRRMRMKDIRYVNKGYKVSFGDDRNVLELDRSDGCATL